MVNYLIDQTRLQDIYSHDVSSKLTSRNDNSV